MGYIFSKSQCFVSKFIYSVIFFAPKWICLFCRFKTSTLHMGEPTQLCYFAFIFLFNLNVTTVNKLSLNNVIWHIIVIVSVLCGCVRYWRLCIIDNNPLVDYWQIFTSGLLKWSYGTSQTCVVMMPLIVILFY